MDGTSRIDHHPAVPAALRTGATALSGAVQPVRARPGQRGAAARVIGALARASLAVGALAMTTGCLITDPPQFKPAKHTRPFLANPDPDPGKVLAVDSQLIENTQSVLKFSADVFSQDDPADPSAPSDFENVYAYLYIDYGYTGGPGDDLQPFRYYFGKRPLDPGTIDQTNRRVSIEWHPNVQRVDPGCHNAVLVVSHVFDDIPCPACSDDVATITWPLLRCDSTLHTCDNLPVTGPTSCKGLTNSCAAVRQKLGDSALACPSDQADGGSP
jgi:hypothetical protein